MSRAQTEWSHKDEWKRQGRGFCVVVSRHQIGESFGNGPNGWCIYAYIYPEHPHFRMFEGSAIWQQATECMPLHMGCSYLDYPMRDGKVTSVQVGCDYNHLHDEHYTHCATKDEAWSVFDDAEDLFKWLQAKAEKTVEVPA